jgi:hypothetical protein
MNYSRKFFPILAAAVLLVFTSFQFQVNSFLAVYQGSEISRKKDSDAGYSRLTELPKSNAGNYFWVDDNLYKDGEGIENISYRLTANTSTGPKYFYAGIQHSPTAIQRSWGSIKSMFR